MEYLTLKGLSPFGKWYKKLDKTLQIKVDARIQRLKTLNSFGDHKNLGQGVHELRFLSKSGLRIYFAKEDDQIILLLIGGNKSSQSRNIEKAKEYWNEYKLRGNNHDK